MNHSELLPPTAATLLTHPFEDKRVGHPLNTSANLIFTTLVLQESNLKKKIVMQEEKTGEVLLKIAVRVPGGPYSLLCGRRKPQDDEARRFTKKLTCPPAPGWRPARTFSRVPPP